MKQTRERNSEMTRSMRLLAILLIPALALILGAAAPQALARGWTIWECEGDLELEESEVFFEFNFTDCDLGIQVFLDGSPWRSMTVRDEIGKPVLNVFTRRAWRTEGGAEFSLEGAEPQLIDPEEEPCSLTDPRVQAFLQQYREGEYTFTGVAAEERCLLLGDAELTYDFPTPPDLNLEDFPEVARWDQPNAGAQVVSYEAVVELEALVEGDEQVFKETATLPAGARAYKTSLTFLRLINSFTEEQIKELKFELLAQEESGNKIIVEAEAD
ncbi:MAG: hypothetical protein QNJ58_26115 [Desulfobacterales bacterium]|nr:hypothetical protein [Desulfobacterales bacterium]